MCWNQDEERANIPVTLCHSLIKSTPQDILAWLLVELEWGWGGVLVGNTNRCLLNADKVAKQIWDES